MVQIQKYHQPSSTPQSQSLSKRIRHMIRILFYMLRKNKLAMDLQLLFKRGKLAGKSITNLMPFHHNNNNSNSVDHRRRGSVYSTFTCRSMDPNLSIYHPNEVEFSCSNTPIVNPSKRRNDRHYDDSYDVDVDMMSKVFEMMSSEGLNVDCSTPSPAPFWSFGKSPKGRQLRITDSPFPVREEGGEGDDDGEVDREAEEFIKRFYEQLRLQQLVPPTPEYRYLVGLR